MGEFNDFAGALISIFQSVGDYNLLPMRLGKGDAARTLWADSTSNLGVPGNVLAYVHIDPGDGDTLESRPREFSIALNPYGYSQYGMPVITAESKKTNMRIILGMDYDEMPQFLASSGVRSMAVQEHSHYLWGPGGGVAANPAWLESNQIVNFSVQPKTGYGLTVQVVGTANRSVYVDGSGSPGVLANNSDVDLSSYVPATASKAIWVCVSINLDTGAISATNGSEFDPTADTPPVIADVSAANMPDVPSGDTGLAYVYLAEGQTSIDHQHIRKIHNLAGSGSQGCGTISTQQNPITYAATIDSGCEGYWIGSLRINEDASLSISAGGASFVRI
jgi:hypothetical protein